MHIIHMLQNTKEVSLSIIIMMYQYPKLPIVHKLVYYPRKGLHIWVTCLYVVLCLFHGSTN